MKITVIGAGKVGSSVALNCSIRELGNILLLDIIEGLPQGEEWTLTINWRSEV